MAAFYERQVGWAIWCEDKGVSLLTLALQFCLRDARIHGNPLASLNIEQLEMNVAAVMDPLADTVLDDLRAAGL